MKLSRREYLAAASSVGVGLAFSGCAPIAHALSARTHEKVLAPPLDTKPADYRFLDRVSFGPRPGDLVELKSLGREAYLDMQLTADQDDDLELKLQLNRLDVLGIDGTELRDYPEDEMLRELGTATLLRAVYGRNQLHERMVDFWTNHFNIYGHKGLAAWRLPKQDKLLRDHALGNFPEMLSATAHGTAMLVFLDNHFNDKGHPNENYAREIMELHTLGVDGGYSQRDVMEVARCFTGWGTESRFLHRRNTFRYQPELHDDGPKEVLGHRIPAGGGQQDAETVLNILAAHPSTARNISRKLCQFFIGRTDGPMVDRLAQIYLKTHGDIRAMLKPLLLSDELLNGPPVLKRPLDYVASSLRALDATTDGGKPLLDRLSAMGQHPFEWPMPDGYPQKVSSWTGTLLARWNYAIALCQGTIGGTSVDWDRLPPHELVALTLGPDKKPPVEGNPSDQVALCLASPEFQWR